MIFFLSLLVTTLFMMMLALLVYAARRPQMQTRRHLEKMIAKAEAQRMAARQQKRKVTVDVSKDDAYYLRDKTFRERVIRPLMASTEAWLMQFAPRELSHMLENMLLHLGVQDKWSVQRLAACWVMAVALGGLLGIFFIHIFNLSYLSQKIAIVAIGLAFGGAVPFALLQSAIRRRQAALRKQLPEFLDFLCVSVQAGLSFDGAVAKIVHRMKGPLMDEFRRMLRDMSMGMNRQRTLNQLARRCDLEELYLFTASVIQAEHLGTSMSRTLKQQADNMRDRHRQNVRAAALKAPVKIIFPMILFIFPSIFVMVIFPSALTLLRSLSK
ncbi:putative type II secretion system protein [Selenomonas ruminantium subsp. lactilytica TAM6421]|uniref:Putative type II secretion system protein n=1 Tax=Selenomonas ruminantium subsp. lactilytica (strain NBRC 103574 / TAM6421) TaxID=927704 RepID=I0GLV0_SELRL|nr:type II secretion system F family protein [Selenomonas ruminantium]BAL81737.1 putative type II secretion system protein [Selenomonas ruminantium subsp. lactilytica TAM6421]